MGQQPEYAALVDRYNTVAKVLGRPVIVNWKVTSDGGIEYTFDNGQTWVMDPYGFYSIVESASAQAATASGQSYTPVPYPFPAGTGEGVTPEYVPPAPPPLVTTAPVETAATSHVGGTTFQEIIYGYTQQPPSPATGEHIQQELPPGPLPAPSSSTLPPAAVPTPAGADMSGLLLIGGAALLLILLLRR